MTETFYVRPSRHFGTFEIGELVECKAHKTPYGFSLRPVRVPTFTRCPDLPIDSDGDPKSGGDWSKFYLSTPNGL